MNEQQTKLNKLHQLRKEFNYDVKLINLLGQLIRFELITKYRNYLKHNEL